MPVVEYTIRRKVFTLFAPKFHVYDNEGNLIGFSKQKAFKLKEDIRIYTDEDMTDERIRIAARSIIDFGAAYDIIDSKTQQKLGALRRKGLKSILRDSWEVMDENDNVIGKLEEDSMMMSLLRRYLGGWIPQRFYLKQANDFEIAEYRTHFNPFILRMTVTVYENCPLNPMLVLAGGLLLVAIEGRQN